MTIRKYFKNKGVRRNKTPLSNIVYKVDIKPVSEIQITGLPSDYYDSFQFKDLGVLCLLYCYQTSKVFTGWYYHGLITPNELKEKLGEEQWSKFCSGKREFIIQRRVNKKNI